jgi:hypothetical protein
VPERASGTRLLSLPLQDVVDGLAGVPRRLSDLRDGVPFGYGLDDGLLQPIVSLVEVIAASPDAGEP